MAESVRGGVARGFRALAGANTVFGSLLVCLGVGLSLTVPHGATLAALQVVGGAFLLWLSIDAFQRLRQVAGAEVTAAGRSPLPPYARGALAVLLNPGGWLFLAAVASPLLASADQHNGTASALVVAIAMMAGIAAGDAAVVLVGGVGIRRAVRAGQWARGALGALLAGLSGWLILTGVISLVTT